ncbi:MAG: acyl-CoA carboxylase subunit epsilon [Propionibacteriaceae bacterium]
MSSDAVDPASDPVPDAGRIKIIGGNPTPEEIAAVVAVIGSRGADAAEPGPEQTSGWAEYWRRTRRSLRPGPDSWRNSLRR